MVVERSTAEGAARVLVRGDLAFGLEAVPCAADACRVEADAEADLVDATPASNGETASGGKAAALEALRVRHDRECPHCTVVTDHTRTVFGEGDPDADLMFVGEAPGEQEDISGRPFVGRAGQLLEKMIVAMGYSRETVYICNVLKTRPPNNATPTSEEARLCAPYLLEQIRIIAPKVIVTLGLPASHLLLGTTSPMRALRGRWHPFPPPARAGGLISDEVVEDYPSIEVMPTYHPAYLLRSYTEENRRKVWADLQMVIARLKGDSPT